MMQNTNIYNICVAKEKQRKNPKEYHLSPMTYIQAHC